MRVSLCVEWDGEELEGVCSNREHRGMASVEWSVRKSLESFALVQENKRRSVLRSRVPLYVPGVPWVLRNQGF